MGFLNGSSVAPTVAPSASTTQNVLPDWYTNYAMQIIANQQAQTASPYPTYQGPRVAGLSPDQQQAMELTRQVARPAGLRGVEGMIQGAAGNSAAGAASPWLSRAGALSATGAADPSLSAGAGYLAQSTDPTGLALASPFLGAASGRSVDSVSAYMDPYQDQVVNRFGDLAARQVREKLLPELTDRFISAGQFEGGGEAPSRFGMELGRGVRDIQESTAAQQAALMSSGYQSAIGASAADKVRAGQLAQTAGALGQQQQQITRDAGTGMVNLGQARGALTSDEQRNLTTIGSTTGQLTTQDTQAQLQAAQQMAAVQKQRQEMGIAGAGALNSAGALQRSVEQQNQDVAYTDFLRQQGYPQAQIDAMVKTLQGVQPAVPKGQLQEGFGAVANQGSNPSGLQTLAGAASTILPFFT